MQALSGLLLVALGLFVATRRPRSRAGVGFGLFAIGLGSSWIRRPFELGPEALTIILSAEAVLHLLAIAGLTTVVLHFPRKLATRERRRVLRWPAVATGGLVVLALAAGLLSTSVAVVEAAAVDPAYGAAAQAYLTTFYLLHAAMWGALFAFATRFRAAGPHERDVRVQCALISAGLAIYPVFWSGGLGALSARADSYGAFATAGLSAAFLAALLLAAVWLRNMMAGPQARSARLVAWAILASLLLSELAELAAAGALGFLADAKAALARVLSVGVFAYAILRHRLFDIDLRVKRTLASGTVAAVFVAVFFLVSETAAQFLGERTGSAYWGIAATALLVFALAPTQRLAARFADRAMPHVREDDPEYVRLRKADVYRAALEGTLADGGLTPREREMLTRLQLELGIANAEAREMERQLGRVAGPEASP